MNEVVELLENYVNNESNRNIFLLLLFLFVTDTVFGITWRYKRQLSQHIPILNSGEFIAGAVQNLVYFTFVYLIIIRFSDDGLSEIIKIAVLVGAMGFTMISILTNYNKTTGHLDTVKELLPYRLQSIFDSENAKKERTVEQYSQRPIQVVQSQSDSQMTSMSIEQPTEINALSSESHGGQL